MDSDRAGIYGGDGERDAYPLVSARCEVSVVDVNVRARVSQTYVSTADKAQSVTYVFPLPTDAAICAFSAVIDNARTVHGVVKERQQAKRAYENAVSAGKTAALLQEHSTQVFEVALGNLKSSQTVVVNIDFVSIVAHTGTTDSLRLKIPVSVAPFYGNPPETLKGVSTPAPGRVFELAASFRMAANIASVASTSHPVSVTLGSSSPDSPGADHDPTTAHVSLSSDTALKDDLILEVTCAGLDAPRCVVQRVPSAEGEDEVLDALSLTLVPRFPTVPVSRQEYIFLVDRSGSMDGPRIAAVRNALQIMLRSLPTKHTTFNIFSFGDSCSALWPTSVEYSRDSVAEASAHVDSMDAEFGGTEVARALQHVFESRQDRKQDPAAVFMLTDGEAWDLEGVFKVVSDAVVASNNALRTFVLGVGDQVSSEMCDGVARAGRGIATYVTGSEKPDAKLVSLLRAARSELVQDVVVDWGIPDDSTDDDFEVVDVPEDPSPQKSAVVSLFDENIKDEPDVKLGPETAPVELPPPPRLQQAPTRLDSLPPLYAGFRYSVFALIRRPRGSPLPQQISVRGRVSGSPAVLDIHVTDASSASPFVQVLAARALVQDIEDTSSTKGKSKSALTKAKIARLGVTYGIVTSQTSFVAVDDAGDVLPSTSEDERKSAEGVEHDMIKTPAPLIAFYKGKKYRRIVPLAINMRARRLKTSDVDASASSEEEDGTSGNGADPSTEVEESDDDMGFACFDDDDTPAVSAPSPSGGSPPAVLTKWTARAVQPGMSGRANTVASQEPVSVASLAREQQFDGAFPDTDAFVLDTLRLPALPPPPPALQHALLKGVWHSVLVIAYLKKHFTTGEEPEAWAFLADKAREFALETLVEVNKISEGEAGSIFDDAVGHALALV